MEKIYLVSGLGADRRVFDFIKLYDCDIEIINWINPNENEKICEYSERLVKEKNVKSNSIIIGVSFGGIIAIELSKITKAKTTILISSFKSHNELPLYYRFLKRTGIDAIFPYALLKINNELINYFFGVKLPEEKLLLKEILKDTDTNFLKWAIKNAIRWEIPEVNLNIRHIHGTSDRIIPIRNIKNVITIHNGGHFMIVNKSGEINELLNLLIKE